SGGNRANLSSGQDESYFGVQKFTEGNQNRNRGGKRLSVNFQIVSCSDFPSTTRSNPSIVPTIIPSS
ncbi:MAG: hypothetical protein PHE82_05795, partial [Syntrophomonadaceae bacterium]|nr:hypothetical protein [Syntrophomonadaceae bacterium]